MKQTLSGAARAKRRVWIGAAFLMATSAVGPGFLTQSTTFTATYGSSLAAVILCVILMDIVTQLNIWSVIGVSGMRAQDIANSLLPGLGYALSFLVAAGGLVFNIGNVGGISLGLNALTGLDPTLGCILGGALAIALFLFKKAGEKMDLLTKALGGVIILAAVYVAISTRPPLGEAARRIFTPEHPQKLLLPMITLLGGSCGGYIAFSGAHRLIDAGVKGPEDLCVIRRSVLLGTSVSGLIRILIFLATLGVCTAGGAEAAAAIRNAGNPAAETFRQALQEVGYRLFGLILLCAGLTSVVGAAYTSVSFLKTLHPFIARNENRFIIGFIALSTTVMAVSGGASRLLVAAGTVNGLILPLSLSLMLIAATKKKIIGAYRHSRFLLAAGAVIALLTLGAAIRALPSLFS
ncbi:MAG: divalent metal cation transporter [Oscillospiraceae bacterium]|nr:divalent metal cation transporter [Oscillospiraceae bacterium]